MRNFLGKVLDQLHSTSERDKYRTRLDRAPDGQGTEIYISHRGMEELYTTREPTVDHAGADRVAAARRRTRSSRRSSCAG